MEEMMRNEEIMDVVEEVVPTSGSGLGTKILGGAIIAGAVIAGYKLVKKYWCIGDTQEALTLYIGNCFP